MLGLAVEPPARRRHPEAHDLATVVERAHRGSVATIPATATYVSRICSSCAARPLAGVQQQHRRRTRPPAAPERAAVDGGATDRACGRPARTRQSLRTRPASDSRAARCSLEDARRSGPRPAPTPPRRRPPAAPPRPPAPPPRSPAHQPRAPQPSTAPSTRPPTNSSRRQRHRARGTASSGRAAPPTAARRAAPATRTRRPRSATSRYCTTRTPSTRTAAARSGRPRRPRSSSAPASSSTCGAVDVPHRLAPPRRQLLAATSLGHLADGEVDPLALRRRGRRERGAGQLAQPALGLAAEPEPAQRVGAERLSTTARAAS